MIHGESAALSLRCTKEPVAVQTCEAFRSISVFQSFRYSRTRVTIDAPPGRLLVYLWATFDQKVTGALNAVWYDTMCDLLQVPAAT